MRKFLSELKARNSNPEGRRWIYLPYDQLSDAFGLLARESPERLGILLVENPQKAARRPYHRQKLAWILCHQRQFALEQAERGVAVDYRVGDYARLLPEREYVVARPAEWELRQELKGIDFVPHEGWLTTREQFLSLGNPPWRMDAFYRKVRQDTGILMVDGKPLGGKYSHDGENRKAWKGKPPAPRPPHYASGWLKLEVAELLGSHFQRHPGQLDLESIPLTLEEIEHYWQWVQKQCLPYFGPYEDAMSKDFPRLFHSGLSPLINLHRLPPRRVLGDVLKLELPLSCQEGFVRQLIGWREFVRHVHESTDGFRSLWPPSEQPSDGGWSTWSGQDWGGAPAGANPNVLKAEEDLPPAFWGQPSGLECLDTVVADVWREGWSHHITRLMILGNLATLLGYSPRQLADWFWVAYIDAFDWVVEPNVLAMATYATGELMTTKPYVSGAAYIQRMSDYCKTCRFKPALDCPITPLYWAFLARHRQLLEKNPRVAMILKNLDKRDQAADAQVLTNVRAVLKNGDQLRT
ncbi:cryptochrome/photolyase family protein [bacterium]|nr:cryptochrome/photolyase family protein [bacterium]